MNALGLMALGASLLSGCASSFHSGELKDVSYFPKVGKQKTARVELAFTGKLNGDPWKQNDDNNREFLEDRLIQSLENSGMFSHVSDSSKTSDIKVLVAIINEKQKSSSKATLSLFTLFLYPNTETDTFKLMAKIQEPATGKSKTIQLEDGVVRRQQLLLGLLAPFKPHGKELEKCTSRLMDNLVLEIHKTGMVK